jgi:molecular chaperone GrpE
VSDDKGKFSTNIGDEVIKAALESVRKRTGEAPDTTPSFGTPAADPAGIEVKVEVEGEAPPAPVGDAKDQEIAELKTQLEVSQAAGRSVMGRIKDEHEKVLRATADLENFKKRAQKEKDELQRFGNEKLLRDLLPVVDNFDRALEHSKGGGDFASLEKGVLMIRKLFEDALGKHGVKAFESKGKPFDPNLHEAMQHVETDDMPPNHVASELLRGFTLNDRLVRPSLVMVSKKKTPAAETPESPQPEPASDDEKKS